MRVLVVDDGVKISSYVAKGLREAGYAVDTGEILTFSAL
jgi:DNA-binding response OmpR family regulator